MKKIFALALVLSLALSLAACGGGDASSTPASTAAPAASTAASGTEAGGDDAEQLALYGNLMAGKPYDGTTLNYLANSPGNDMFEMQMKFTREIFTPLTGIEVVWDQGPWNAVLEKMVADAVGGTGSFDLYMIMDAWGPSVVNYLMPINDYIERDGIDISDFPPGFMDFGKMGDDSGNIYGLPTRGHFQTVYYRTDIYEELGLEVPVTMDEFYANMDAVKEAYPDMGAITVPYGMNAQQNLMPWYNFFYSLGGEFFDEDMMPIFNSEAGIEATQMYVDLLLDGYALPADLAYAENDARDAFGRGEAAHFINWSWARGNYDNAELTSEAVLGNVSNFAVPQFVEGTPATTPTNGFATAIPQASKNQDAAWEYVKFLSSEQLQLDVCLDLSEYSVNSMTRTSVMTNPDINALEGREGMWEAGAQVLETSRGIPLLPEYAQVSALLEIAVNNAASGADVKTELDNAAAQATPIMEAAYG